MMNRRSLITGLISFVAAPAIVRAGSLMPVKVMVEAEAKVPITTYYFENRTWVIFRNNIIYFSDGADFTSWTASGDHDLPKADFVLPSIRSDDRIV